MIAAAHENIEREFYGDVRSRKSLVPSARHKKCGSKTKFVSLPHDKLTQGAWKKMNGETRSFNLREPMSWKEFKDLPADLMEEYIEFLSNEYSATGANIAKELGVTYGTLNRVVSEKNISGAFHRGAKQPKKEIERMHLFFNPEEATVEEPAVEELPDDTIESDKLSDSENGETKDETKIEPPPLFKAHMSKFTMEFSGEYDEKSLLNTMRLMVGEGTVCKIKIEVEKEGF